MSKPVPLGVFAIVCFFIAMAFLGMSLTNISQSVRLDALEQQRESPQ